MVKQRKANSYRTLEQTDIRAVDGAERRFILSFSSEEPVDRFCCAEILDHSDGAVDLTRLNEIGCLLFNHDRNIIIGKIIRAWTENNRGYAEVEFDTDDESEKIFQKVKNKTLKGVSVGYRVDSWEELAPNKMSADGRFHGPADIARKWTALEISIVSIPADATVGVGRQYNDNEEGSYMESSNNTTGAEVRETNVQALNEGCMENPSVSAQAHGAESRTSGATVQFTGNPPNSSAEEIERALQEERMRTAEIGGLCREFGIEPDVFIRDGARIEEVQRQVLEQLRQTRRPVSASVTSDEQDKFRKAASDGFLLRAGLDIQDAAPGANEFRCMSLKDLAVDCLSREGVANAHRMDHEILLRQFFNPGSAFPSIMDMTIEKAYVQGYNTVAATFDKWTTKGSLKDFKETKGNYYLAGPAGEFLLVPEGGELKADLPKDEVLPKRKLNTYGRQFTMTRTAFINDDIGFLTTLPSRYAATAKRTINKQVYDILLNNPVIYDGTPLFGANHKNLVETGTGVTNKALRKMINMLRRQRDQFGQPIMIEPKFLIVPIGLGFEIMTILRSPTINMSDNTQAVNPMYNYPFVVIEEPSIEAEEGQPTPWFLAANPTAVRTIQVDYLNGQEMPTIRRMEHAGQLGFVWDIYLDWGVNVLDYRGLLKNPGIAFTEED